MSQEKLVLKITGPDGTTQTRALEEAEHLLIGSGEKAALRLEDAEVSTLHSMVKVDQGEVTVIDLGSATGTRVAGRPIQGATRLEPGTLLEIGRMRIELAALAAPTVVPQASPGGLATRLLEESLPPGEAPASDARQLEVAMLWGDSLLDVRHYRAAQVVRIGSQRSNDFHLDGAGESFELARCADESCTLSIPPGASVRWRGGAAKSTTTLELNDRVQMSLGTVSFVARWVRPPAQAKAATRGRDFNFAKVLTTSVMGAAAILAAIFMTDTGATALSEDIFKGAQRWQIVFKSPSRMNKRPLKLQVKEPTQKPKEERFESAKHEKTAGAIDPLKKEKDRQKVMRSGLLDFFNGPEGANSNVFTSTGMGSKINEALGELKSNDSTVGDSGGVGGISRGAGPGGGINNLGVNGVFTRPGGRGHPGGHNPFELGFDDSRKRQTSVLPPKTVVVGGCERPVIARVISRHASEIRFCYETALSKNQNLAGKIAVSFTIDPTGAVSEADIAQSTLNDNSVEQCVLSRIRRWAFPQPKGGVCVINYPWVLQPAGAGAEADE